MLTISPVNYLHLLALIESRTGIRVGEHKQSELVRLVERVMQNNKGEYVSDFEVFLFKLSSEPVDGPLWQQFIDIITVGETYFFRNQAQFDALNQSVLPELIEKRRQSGQKYLRLWSAGCASGEEPYSIAMLLQDLISDIDTWQIVLLATDINATSLERARQGVYRNWAFRNETPSDIRKRWFRRENDAFRLSDDIRQMVKLMTLNLLSDEYPSFESGTMNMDLIMCRNVTIYFDQATTREIIGRFHRALTPNGWLVVGHSEPMASVYQGFEPRNFPHTILYQKSLVSEALVFELPAPAVSPNATPSVINVQPAKTTIKASSQPTPQPTPLLITPPPVETGHECPAQDANAAWQRAKQAADREDWNTALIALAQAESENKFQPHIYHLRATIEWHMGDLEGALASLRHAIYCDSTFAIAHYTLGELHEASGNFEAAAREWRITKQILSQATPTDPLPFTDDLTVEMLQSLIEHRLTGLAAKKRA